MTTKPINWTRARQTLLLLEQDEMYHELLAVAVGYYTGFRLSDMMTMKYKDFNGDTLQVNEQKTSKQRDIPILFNLKRIVALCRIKLGGAGRLKKTDNDYLFVRKRIKQYKHICDDSLNARITTALKYCGITNRQLTSHTLRKTFALRYYNLHVPQVGEQRALIALSRQLNHASIEVTMRYIGINVEVERLVFANWD